MAIDINKIEEQVFKGLRNAFRDSFLFSNKPVVDIKPEYLITVNLAKSIGELNIGKDYTDCPVKICLEEKARLFLSNCQVCIKSSDLFIPDYWKELKSGIKKKSKQKVDIAIYEKSEELFEDKPLTVIEVKRFTKYLNSIRKDIFRNLSFLGIYKGKLYDSRLKQSYLVLLHNDEVTKINKEKAEYIEKLKEEYNSFLKGLEIPDEVEYSIQAESIAKDLFSEIQEKWPDEIKNDFAETLYHYIGVIIKFKRK